MGSQEENRSREQLSGAEDNVFQKMLDQISDFGVSLFGQQAKATGQTGDLMEKVKELSGNVVQQIVDFNDSVLKTLKLDENESVSKVQVQAKDMLRQAGLLEEEFDSEDYY